MFLFPLPSDPLQPRQSVFFHSLPLFLVSSILTVTISSGILVCLFILSVCPHNHHPSDLINFTVLAPLNVALPAYLFFCQLSSASMGP